MRVSIDIARPAHVDEVLERLRDVDKSTFISYPTAREILLDEIKGVAWVGLIDGRSACLWGIRPATILNDRTYLWLLTTTLVEENPFLFVRHSQIKAKELLKTYSVIYGWVIESNGLSVKWLRWLGCTFSQSEPGILEFELRRA